MKIKVSSKMYFKIITVEI